MQASSLLSPRLSLRSSPPRAARVCLLALLLAACGEPSSEEAKQKLAEKNLPVAPETLLASTKSDQSADDARLLVIAGADPNARQPNGMTALMSAAFNGQADVAKLLLEKGADVNAEAAGFNALSLAVERRDKAMVKLLLAHGAQPKARPAGGLSALEKARQRNDEKMAALLQGD